MNRFDEYGRASRMVVNDAHIHCGHSRFVETPITIRSLEKMRSRYGINHMIVMPFEKDVDKNNDALVKYASANKWLHPLHWITGKQDEHNHINELLKAGKILGAKFHGRFENLPISDPKYASVLETLTDNDGVILIHNGRFKDASRESNTSYIHALEVAKMYPSLRILMAHMGGTDTGICEKAITAAKDMKNVYFDTSGITTPVIVEFALKQIGANRIVFASDIPWCSFNGMLCNVLDAKIKESKKVRILQDNFMKLVGL